MSDSRRRPRKLALALAAAVATLGVLELGVRALTVDLVAGGHQRAERRLEFVRPSPNARRVYELVPNTEGRIFRTDASINRHGFRGGDVPLERTAGVRRIVVLGDSITFGVGVRGDETYARRLEQLLADAGTPTEVLNLGVTGYDTLQAVAFLEEVGTLFQPDLVLLGHCFNDLGTHSVLLRDIVDGVPYSSWIYRSRLVQWLRLRFDRRQARDHGTIVNDEEPFRSTHRATIASLEGDPELLTLMGELGERVARSGEPLHRESPLPWHSSPAHVGKLRYAFEALAQVAGEHGFDVLVAVIGYLDEGQLTAEHDLAYAIVEREARRVGLDVLQLAPALRAANPQALKQLPDDPLHPNARGHEVIARELSKHLLR